jgi:hypothetical protein
VSTASVARNKGCPVISITGDATSNLGRPSDIVLLSVSRETVLEKTSSRISRQAIVQTLDTALGHAIGGGGQRGQTDYLAGADSLGPRRTDEGADLQEASMPEVMSTTSFDPERVASRVLVVGNTHSADEPS